MGEKLSKLISAGGVQAGGSVLDRVISQPSSEDHTVLYKLADYKKGKLDFIFSTFIFWSFTQRARKF